MPEIEVEAEVDRGAKVCLEGHAEFSQKSRV